MSSGAGLLVVAVVVAGCGDRERAGTPTQAPPTATPPATAAAATAALAPKSHVENDGPGRGHEHEPIVECPAALTEHLDDEGRLAVLLEAANAQIEKGGFAAAWTCADRAADLVPASVEAHHLRGAALAALGRDHEAQVAFSLALALDPDDPETLRAVADFYINSKAERGRDALRLGLELAQRGTRRVMARRRRNPPLAADLAVLEAQALNDLGRSADALTRIEAALRVAPGRGDALHEKGVALFDLSRFPEAKVALRRAIEIQPNDAFTHQILGLTLEQLGQQAEADESLERAQKLAPKEIARPVLITKDEFQTEIEAVVDALPAERRSRVKAIRIEVADLPDSRDLSAVDPPFPPTILGLYRGPVGPAALAPPQPGDEPPSIVLYRKNLARAVKTRLELSEQIRETLLHEIGHLEGLDEDDLRRRGME